MFEVSISFFSVPLNPTYDAIGTPSPGRCGLEPHSLTPETRPKETRPNRWRGLAIPPTAGEDWRSPPPLARIVSSPLCSKTPNPGRCGFPTAPNFPQKPRRLQPPLESRRDGICIETRRLHLLSPVGAASV